MEIIRQLTHEDDLADLITLSREFFDEYETHHTEFFEINGLEDAHITDFFMKSIDSDDAATFVAIAGQRAVGYITVQVRAQAGFYKVNEVGAISGLMIHREFRRSGIGTRLLAQAQVYFKKRGIGYLTVYTAATNEIALRFYEKSGLCPLYTTFIGEINAL